MAISTRNLSLANLIEFRRERGDRVFGLRTLNSEYLIHQISTMEIEVVKVSFNVGAVETGRPYRGSEFKFESRGLFLVLQLTNYGSHVLTTSVIQEIIGLNEILDQTF